MGKILKRWRNACLAKGFDPIRYGGWHFSLAMYIRICRVELIESSAASRSLKRLLTVHTNVTSELHRLFHFPRNSKKKHTAIPIRLQARNSRTYQNTELRNASKFGMLRTAPPTSHKTRPKLIQSLSKLARIAFLGRAFSF